MYYFWIGTIIFGICSIIFASSHEDISFADCEDMDPLWQDSLKEELRSGNCLGEIEIVTPEDVQRAARLFHRDGFVVVRDALPPSQVQRVRSVCEELANKMLARDSRRIGNRGPYRYSFGKASKTGHILHLPEIAELVDLPTLTPILKTIFGNDRYVCRGARGDFNLPGALYQPLHSDVWPAFFEEAVPTAWPDSGRLNYRDLPPFYVATNFIVTNITYLNAPIRQIPMTQNSQLPIPSLDDEPLWMKRSTLCPLSPGSVVIRDVRAWHGGTPNLSEEMRILPNIEYYASWFRHHGSIAGSSTQMGTSMPWQVYENLSPFGQTLCREVVANPGQVLDTSMPDSVVTLNSNILKCHKKMGLTDEEIEEYNERGEYYDYGDEISSDGFYGRKFYSGQDIKNNMKDEL